MHRLRIFLRLPLSVTPILILSVNKKLRNFGRIPSIAKSSSIFTKFSWGHMHQTFWRSWRKVTTHGKTTKSFFLHLSSRTYFAKIEDKKRYCKNSFKNLSAGFLARALLTKNSMNLVQQIYQQKQILRTKKKQTNKKKNMQPTKYLNP